MDHPLARDMSPGNSEGQAAKPHWFLGAKRMSRKEWASITITLKLYSHRTSSDLWETDVSTCILKSERNHKLPDMGTWPHNSLEAEEGWGGCCHFRGDWGIRWRSSSMISDASVLTLISGEWGPRWFSSPMFCWGEALRLMHRGAHRMLDVGIEMCRNKWISKMMSVINPFCLCEQALPMAFRTPKRTPFAGKTV